MIRAVRLAATLEFADRAGDAGRHPGTAGLAAHLSGERIAAELDAARRPTPVDRPSADGATPASWRRSRRSSRHSAACPRTRCPARTSGTTRCRVGRRARARPADRPAGGAAPRHRQARDVRRRPLRRPRDRRRRAGRQSSSTGCTSRRAAAGSGRPPGAQPHVRYEPDWSDAAVRRFIRRIGAGGGALDELLELARGGQRRRGLPPDAGLEELRARVDAELAARGCARRCATWPSTATT